MIGKDTKIPKMVLLAPLASAVLMVIAWVISFVGGSVWWSAAFLTLAIILSFMLVLTTVRAILGSVHMLTEGTKSMLDGDLTKRIDVVGKGEIGEAEKGFNSFAGPFMECYIFLLQQYRQGRGRSAGALRRI